jgi:probable HAF family extracellular repeat protein
MLVENKEDTMKVKIWLRLMIWLVAILLPIAANATPKYTVMDLGTLGGPGSEADSLNARGQIAGTSDINIWNPDIGRWWWHAFFWDTETGLVDLGTLGGPTSWAIGLNNRGQVVGAADTTFQGQTWHGFFWDPQTGLMDLGTLGGPTSYAWALNNRGQIVGAADLAGTTAPGQKWRAYIWDKKRGMVDLGSLGGPTSDARGINDRGQVVGAADMADAAWPNQHWHAYLWDEEAGMADLGTLGGPTSFARGINDKDTVVGSADTGFWNYDYGWWQVRAFIWNPKVGMRDLGTLGGPTSYAWALNNRGQIVGAADVEGTTVPGQKWHACLWDIKDGLVDLNDLISASEGWELTDARAINNAGQIAGYGLHNGSWRAFVLSPTPKP